jgi:hypothetical protein
MHTHNPTKRHRTLSCLNVRRRLAGAAPHGTFANENFAVDHQIAGLVLN